MVITGGPSGPDVVTLGYKGCLWLKVTVKGKKAHGSEPHEGINAIEKMAKIQRGLMELNDQYAAQPGSWPVDPAESNRPTLVMSRLVADGVTVPDKCALYIDRRLTPEESVREAIQSIQDVIDAAAADDDQLKAELEPLHVVENPATPPESRLSQALMKNIRGVLNTDPKTAVWTYYTEFRCFPTVWGSETVNYSPGLPKVYRGPDEYVGIDDLVNGTKVLALTIRDLIG
jgi:acetylornithine deacetylase/succinyl-diaminopimelate desuccinylase-like protein